MCERSILDERPAATAYYVLLFHHVVWLVDIATLMFPVHQERMMGMQPSSHPTARQMVACRFQGTRASKKQEVKDTHGGPADKNTWYEPSNFQNVQRRSLSGLPRSFAGPKATHIDQLNPNSHTWSPTCLPDADTGFIFNFFAAGRP